MVHPAYNCKRLKQVPVVSIYGKLSRYQNMYYCTSIERSHRLTDNWLVFNAAAAN